ncbi:Flp pilus assembly protein CpaB [Marinitenerispora sediminis]|uniref:Flp pilus assembly protein CpaB n=1 Tax=Marinitenerispora sediminis TaxID=1931232 RepID=A0A368T7K1_9ACTN|nr:Flp pilus assembly protein CpaB [Marinitenerispora sediminis]RCV57954.1 Flp pilus assembly protein CpaB [Marinitenerispora sediminis]RCV59704.1 Flp pilus assembly protein CpaB [Marinitenerispora sediminis]RCV62313.1 Flp pilus assembly protein CpaB [Marinitenerispora sediminis]
MNPRQRRGVLLMIVAGIGAIAVLFTIVSYANTLQNEMGTYRVALRLTEDVPPYQPISEDQVEEFAVPARFFDDNVFLTGADLDEALGRLGRQPVSATFLDSGTLLQKSMVVDAPELDEGEREIAIMINAETGVAGKVDRQSRVDIYAAYQPNDQQSACAVRVLTDVEVLEVGEIGSEIDAQTGGTNSVVPVTFRLDPEETLRLTYAEGFADKLRLALVSPEGSGDPGDLQFCSADQAELLERGGSEGAR